MVSIYLASKMGEYPHLASASRIGSLFERWVMGCAYGTPSSGVSRQISVGIQLVCRASHCSCKGERSSKGHFQECN